MSIWRDFSFLALFKTQDLAPALVIATCREESRLALLQVQTPLFTPVHAAALSSLCFLSLGWEFL